MNFVQLPTSIKSKKELPILLHQPWNLLTKKCQSVYVIQRIFWPTCLVMANQIRMDNRVAKFFKTLILFQLALTPSELLIWILIQRRRAIPRLHLSMLTLAQLQTLLLLHLIITTTVLLRSSHHKNPLQEKIFTTQRMGQLLLFHPLPPINKHLSPTLLPIIITPKVNIF